MPHAPALLTILLVVAVVWRRSAGVVRRVDGLVDRLDHDLPAWQDAHGLDLIELDRRLSGIEGVAGTAEVEARAVSERLQQLADDLKRQPVGRSSARRDTGDTGSRRLPAQEDGPLRDRRRSERPKSP